jgi:hypothetical protein
MPTTLNRAGVSLLLSACRIQLLRLGHPLLCSEGRRNVLRGRVPATLPIKRKTYRHHSIHRATDDVSRVHDGSWIEKPLNIAGERGPLPRLAICCVEGAVVVEGDRGSIVPAATTPAVKKSPLADDAHDFSFSFGASTFSVG